MHVTSRLTPASAELINDIQKERMATPSSIVSALLEHLAAPERREETLRWIKEEVIFYARGYSVKKKRR